MANADHIAEDVHLELSQLWMLPILLLQMMCAFFAGHLDRLHEMRRSDNLPANWQDHLDGLLNAEWPVRQILAEGARRILAGEPLDLQTIPYADPPEGLMWCPPHSAMATHLRMEALARFHADPEAAIRSWAARIAARAAAKRFGVATETGARALMVSNSRQAAPSLSRACRRIEPRGRLAPSALHVHTHPP